MRDVRIALVLALTLVACGPAAPTPDAGPTPVDAQRMRTPVLGPSGATCPTGSTVTYDSFAATFFSTHCTRCHSSTLTDAAMRNGAPMDVNLDMRASITAAVGARVDSAAAGGPTRVNIFMPLGPPIPSDEDRDRLGEWIACGMP